MRIKEISLALLLIVLAILLLNPFSSFMPSTAFMMIIGELLFLEHINTFLNIMYV